MVSNFVAPQRVAEPSEDFVKHYFNIPKVKLSDYHNWIKTLHAEDQEFCWQQLLMTSFASSKIGKYSVFHMSSIYRNGYDHEDTEHAHFMYVLSLFLPCYS
jgi:hypothetical protein